MSAPEDSTNSLLFLESSLITLSNTELQLGMDLDLYRKTMTPLIQTAAMRVMGHAQAHHMIRQMFADSYLAQEHMKKVVSHASLAYDAALALKRSLS